MRGPSLSEIAQALNDDPARWAPIIIGQSPNKAQSNAREMRFYDKGGLRVTLHGTKRGKWSHYGHDDGYGDMLDLIRYINGCSRDEALRIAKDMLGISQGGEPLKLKPRPSDAELEAEEAEGNAKRIRIANWIWKQASRKIAPEALAYLKNRGISTILDKLPASIRYRKLNTQSLVKMEIEVDGQPPRFPGGLHALMFGATMADGGIAAVQQVILDGDKKADIPNKKRSNGLMEGAAVRLAEPETDLDVAEGPETGLSCWQATGIATWIALGASNLLRLPIPAAVKRIRFAVEIEPSRTGIKSALKAAYHWMRKNKDVLLAMPRLDGDMNDVDRKFGTEAVREDMDGALAPERNPFRNAAGDLLSEEAQNELPIVFTKTAEDALAVWQATGLGSIPLLKEVESIGYFMPDDVKKALIILIGEEKEPEYDLKEGVTARVLRLQTPIAEIMKQGGGAAVRKLLRLNTIPGKLQPAGIEAIALNPEGLVVLATGRGSASAARELFPGAAVLGISTSVDSASIDWSILAGHDVLVAPSNLEDHILAAEQVASDAVRAGARSVKLVNWPAIAPMKTGWKAKGATPKGYDFRWLVAEGWTPKDTSVLLRLSPEVGLSEAA